MALFARKSTIPAQDEALPGRNTPLPISGKHFVNGSNIKQPAPGGLEEAVFGLGCFWGAERKFWQIPGRGHHRGGLCRRPHAECHL